MPLQVVQSVSRTSTDRSDQRSDACSPRIDGVRRAGSALDIHVGMSLGEAQRIMIMHTLNSCGGNKTRAAAVLGISLKTLYNRLNEYSAAEPVVAAS